MKTVEEKAKAYNKALVIARSRYSIETEESVRICLELMFPELKESEDEKIRKAIKLMYSFLPNNPKYIGGVPIKEIFAWLEKQGKNNMGISEATKKELEDNLNKALEKETPESWNKFLDEQSEQKPVFEMKTPEESLGVDSDTYNKIVDECIYGKQKPVDKVEPKFKVDVCADVYNHYNNREEGELEMHRLSDFQNELASILMEREYEGSTETEEDIKRGRLDYELAAVRLAPRLLSHVTKEWSEEDKEKINSVCNIIADKMFVQKQAYKSYYKNLIDFLKSLKDRYTWKPSESDIIILEQVIDGTVNPINYQATLHAILEQLKKLMEK